MVNGVTDESTTVRETRAERRGKKVKQQKKQRPLWQEIPILLLVAAVLSFLLQTFIARVYLIPSESMEPTLHGCTGCTGDRIVVEKISYDFGDPQSGNVVVFLSPKDWPEPYKSIRSTNTVIRGIQNFGSIFGLVPPDENDLVKRVIATGGQTVKCCDAQGRVEVNDKPLNEPYAHYGLPPYSNDFIPGQQDCTTPNRSSRCFGPVIVPSGRLFVMGDNRSNSADSSYHWRAMQGRIPDDQLAAMSTVPVDNVRGKAVFKIWPPSRIGPVPSPNPQ